MTARPQMVPLTGRGAQALIWLYFATMAILAIWSLGDVRSPGPTIAALALFGIMCAGATRDAGNRLSAPVAWLSVIAWPLITFSISWQLLVVGGYAHWFLGAATTCAFYLALRGRVTLAWIGFGLVTAVAVGWAAVDGVGVPAALILIGKQAPILLVGTLFSLGIERTTARIARVTAAEAARAVDGAAEDATARERSRRLAELDSSATALLRRLVDPQPLTADDRQRFAAAEAELRDTVRGRALTVAALVDLIRDARRRGVEVVLLDDSDPDQLDPVDHATAIDRIAAAVAATNEGRLVARLLPPGRDDVATIMIEGPTESRRESVPARSARA